MAVMAMGADFSEAMMPTPTASRSGTRNTGLRAGKGKGRDKGQGGAMCFGRGGRGGGRRGAMCFRGSM